MIGAVQCGYKRNDCAEKQTRLRLGLAGSLLTNSEQQPSGDKFSIAEMERSLPRYVAVSVRARIDFEC
jgi:hypothetical protein